MGTDRESPFKVDRESAQVSMGFASCLVSQMLGEYWLLGDQGKKEQCDHLPFARARRSHL